MDKLSTMAEEIEQTAKNLPEDWVKHLNLDKICADLKALETNHAEILEKLYAKIGIIQTG